MLWLILMLATVGTYALGQREASNSHLGWVSLMFALAVFKGWWVALDFMGLRHASALWRRLVLGWLLVVPAGLVLMVALAA
ncbi:MAG: hypothetical protein Fur007_06980 [Rhodoferax sp.]